MEKLTSDMPGDDGHPIGFPQLKEGKGFEIMSCVTNARDLAVINTSWSVEGLKSLFTPQTKVYLRPIQMSLRLKVGQENRLTCKLKEKSMSCSKEIPLNELRLHLVTCNCNVFDDNVEDEVMVLSDESRNDFKDYMANALSSATVSTKEVESLSIGQGGSAYPSPSVPLVASDSDSSPMLTFPSSSGNGNQAEAGPSSSQGISTISEIPFIDSLTEFSAHPLEGTSLGPLTTNDHITMEKLGVDIALIMPKIKEHIYSTGWIYLYYFDHVVSIYCKIQKI